MITIKFKYGFIKFKDIWFPHKYSFRDLFGFTSYKGGNFKNCFGFFKEYKKSVRHDLTVSSDIIWNNIKKNTRYDINKGKQANLLTTFDTIGYMEFINLYNIFLEKKSLSLQPLNLNRLEKYKNNIKITSIFKDDTWLSIHVYLYTEQYAELLYSIVNIDIDHKLTGIANKLLHWNDILYYKNNGISIYDWGGLPMDDSLPGISKFKLSFGGQEVIYNIYYSPLYKFTFFIKRLKNVFN
ncbi:TPA: hypothetical protein L3G43_002463 [Morganella morganii]|nr:hypothetical protein [Morganella morganii]